MARRIFFVATIALVMLAFFFAVDASAQNGKAKGRRRVAGEILVKFKSDAGANGKAEAHKVGRGKRMNEIPHTGLQLVAVPNGDEEAALARYRRHPLVLYAEPNYVRSIPETSSQVSGSQIVPGDRNFGEQWALHNTGQDFLCIDWIFGNLCFYRGTPDADIDAPEGWAVSTGNTDVKVAVIDSGVDYTNPDLAPNYAGGYDFATPDLDPMDDNGHGTHVAGTIAAAINNANGETELEEGVAGVAPNARILAYKVCRADGTCTDFAVLQAIARAIADGAKVINMSLGSPEYSQAFDEAVQAAWNAGIVVVAAAGNDGRSDVRSYPAAFDHVISVAAFDEDGLRASFSNYGTWVDMSAPGNVIMSTYQMASCPALSDSGNAGCYTWLSGTSMASPHVAGAAALVWSRPDVTTNSQVVDILLNSADPAGVANERLDAWTVHGGLNLHHALSYGVTNLPPEANAGADQSLPDDNADGVEQVMLDGSASSDPDGSISSYEWREGSTVIGFGATLEAWLPVGAHTLTLEVTDNQGATGSDTVVVTVTRPQTPPTAGDVSVSAVAGSPVTITLNASDADTCELTFSVVQAPASGALGALQNRACVTGTPNSDSARVVFTPGTDAGTVTFTYKANDGTTDSNVATVTITVEPPPVLVTIAATTATAAESPVANGVFTVTRSGGVGAPLTVQYAVSGTATSVSDYQALTGTLTIPAGQASATIPVVPIDDSLVESNESVVVTVTPSQEYQVGSPAAATVSVVSDDTPPDLVLTALTVPATAGANTVITITATTRNQGTGAAGTSVTGFYLSANSVLDAADPLVGTRSVPSLAAGAIDSASLDVTIPANTAGGNYYIIASADWDNAIAESQETNNTKAAGTIRIGPDLTVTALTAPAVAAVGGSIVVGDTTANVGWGSADASVTQFYLSANAALDASDVLLGSHPVGSLAVGASISSSTTVVVPSVLAGQYFLIAQADGTNAVAENVENNNIKTTPITIGADLIVTVLTVPQIGAAGGTIVVSDTTKNQGGAIAPPSQTGYYLSTDATFDAGDIFLAARDVPTLAEGAVNTGSLTLQIPAGTVTDTYTVIARADASGVVAEKSETNNTRGVGIKVGPDLSIPTFTGTPTTVTAGLTFTANVTVKNSGAGKAAATMLQFRLSVNTTLDAGDGLIGSRSVGLLAAGASESGSTVLTIPVGTAAGTYSVIAVADADGTLLETSEINNSKPLTIRVVVP